MFKVGELVVGIVPFPNIEKDSVATIIEQVEMNLFLCQFSNKRKFIMSGSTMRHATPADIILDRLKNGHRKRT